MDFYKYLIEFHDIINENYPDKQKRTIENYIETFADYPPDIEEFYRPKCPMAAEVERITGNQIFMTGNYEEAAMMYTNSIKKAPIYSKCAALAYANRSAALYHLELWKDCISDIDKALDLPYPNDLRIKIMSRKETALNKLEEAEKSLETNINNNTDTDTNINRNKYKNKNNNNTRNNESDKKDITNKYNKPVRDLTHGDNHKLPGASRGIDLVRVSKEKRKLIATMPFQTGDILMIEKPYLATAVLDQNPIYCHHCFKKSLSLIPCNQCSRAIYCDEKCRADAYDNYHRIECKIQCTIMSAQVLNVTGLLCQLRSLNIFTKQGNDLNELERELKELEEKTTDPTKLGFTGDQFIGHTKKAFLSSLVDIKIQHDLGVLFEAGYIVTLLRNFTDFFKSNSDVPMVAKFLLKLTYAYALNHFQIPSFGEYHAKAHAAFPLFHLANHACVNNTVTHIDEDGNMVLRASQFIRPGDEILFDYRDLKFSFEEASTRTGRTIQCKRICIKCDKTYVYPSQRQPCIKMDKGLRSMITKNPYDINGLWRILNLVRGKHQHYTLQAQIIKTMLVDAYEGRVNVALGRMHLTMVGIL